MKHARIHWGIARFEPAKRQSDVSTAYRGTRTIAANPGPFVGDFLIRFLVSVTHGDSKVIGEIDKKPGLIYAILAHRPIRQSIYLLRSPSPSPSTGDA